MTISDWIQIATAIGTLLAALAAYFSANSAKKSVEVTSKQLDEMKTQREHLQKPELFIGNTGTIPMNLDENIENTQTVHLPLINLGAGAATDIMVSFSFYKNDLELLAKDNNLKNKLKYKCENKSEEIYSYSYIKNGKVHWKSFIHNKNDFNDSIISYITQNTEIEISLPREYILLLSLLSSIQMPLEGVNSPRISIKLSYKDSYMKEYKKEFVFRTEFEIKMYDTIERGYSLNLIDQL